MTQNKAPLPPAESAAALFKQAAQYLTAGDPAAASLLPILEHFADYAPGWLVIGHALCRAGRHEAAAVALRRALQGRPTSAALTHRIGQGFVELGDSEGAVTAFRRALALDPDVAAVWYSLGLALEDLRDHAAAADAYGTALRLQPDFHQAAFNLGIVLQEDGRMEEAMDAYAEALRMKPASFGRIAQALVSSRTGVLWLRPADLRLALACR